MVLSWCELVLELFWSCFVLSCLVLSCLWSCSGLGVSDVVVHWSCFGLVWSYVLSWFGFVLWLSCLVSSFLDLGLVWSWPGLCLVLGCFYVGTWSCLVAFCSCLVLSCLVLLIKTVLSAKTSSSNMRVSIYYAMIQRVQFEGRSFLFMYVCIFV